MPGLKQIENRRWSGRCPYPGGWRSALEPARALPHNRPAVSGQRMHRQSPGGRRPRPGRATTCTGRAAASSRRARRAATVRRRKPVRGGRSALPRDPPGRSSTLQARSWRRSRQVRGLARSSRDSRRRWSGIRGRRGRAPQDDADRCMPRMRAEGVHGRPARARARTSAECLEDATSPPAMPPPARPNARSRPWGRRNQRAARLSDVRRRHFRHNNAFQGGAPAVLPPSLFQSISYCEHTHPPPLRTSEQPIPLREREDARGSALRTSPSAVTVYTRDPR